MLNLGNWSLDPGAARLRRAGEEKHLDAKEMAVLLHLVEAAPDTVSIEDLLARHWAGVVVGDNAVHQVVARLRRALGDDARSPSYIETLPKRGYRLLVPVGSADAASLKASSDSAAVRSRGWWWMLASLLLSAALVTWLYPWSGRSGLSERVVVLPLTTHTSEPRLVHFARGFHDELVHALARDPALSVVASTARAPASEQGFVLSGSLRPSSLAEVRVALRLNHAGRVIWSGNYDLSIDETVGGQVAVADQVSETVSVTRSRLRWLADATDSNEARYAVLRAGLLAGRDTVDGARRSLGYYDQAIRLDPDFAAAYALKGVTYRTFANWYVMDTRKAVAEMRHLAGEALRRDANLPFALTLDATIRLYDLDYARAEASLQSALSLASEPPILAITLLAHCGRFNEALERLGHAIATNPVHPRYLEHYQAQFLWYARRHAEALAVLDSVLAVTPGDARAQELRAYVLQSLGRDEEAAELLSTAYPPLYGWVSHAYGDGGLHGIGRGFLRVAEEVEEGRGMFLPAASAWRLYVRGHAILGDPEAAVAWMKKGWALGDRWEFFYNRVYPWPGFDDLRAHAGFKTLMRQTIGDPKTCPGYVD